MDFWTKLEKKGLKQKERISPSNVTYLKERKNTHSSEIIEPPF